MVTACPAYWLGEGVVTERNRTSVERVCDNPQVFVFHDAPPGVFFPAYEPSRWLAGLVPRLMLAREAQNVKDGYYALGDMAEAETDLILGLVSILLVAGWRDSARSVLTWWFLWLPAIFGVFIFWLVHIETRFIAPFLIIGFIGLYSAALIAARRRLRILTPVLLGILLVQGSRAGIAVGKGFLGTSVSWTRINERVVDDLARAGVPRGERVAVIGSPMCPTGPGWASIQL